MAKISGNEIKPGMVIEHDGGLWAAVKANHVKPGKGGAYNQVELKNLIDGTKLNERFRAAETVEKVRLEQKDFSFLYEQGEALVAGSFALGDSREHRLEPMVNMTINHFRFRGDPVYGNNVLPAAPKVATTALCVSK